MQLGLTPPARQQDLGVAALDPLQIGSRQSEAAQVANGRSNRHEGVVTAEQDVPGWDELH